MAEKRRKSTAEFREGAVRIVTETGKPVPEVAKDPGINETTLASWVSRAKRSGKDTPGDRDALIARLASENAALKKERLYATRGLTTRSASTVGRTLPTAGLPSCWMMPTKNEAAERLSPTYSRE